jgi:CheY-like chemotaxis protein
MDISILHVQDDAEAISLQQEAFRRTRMPGTVEVVTEGQLAIDYLAESYPLSNRRARPLPRLILLKFKLPRTTGLDVLQWIRAQPSLTGLVVIFLGSWNPISDLERAYQCGANSCIQQPADLQAWMEMARLVNEWWLKRNEYAPIWRGDWRRSGQNIHPSE